MRLSDEETGTKESFPDIPRKVAETELTRIRPDSRTSGALGEELEERVNPGSSNSECCNKPRQHIKRKRHYFVDKSPDSQSYGFTTSHVRM